MKRLPLALGIVGSFVLTTSIAFTQQAAPPAPQGAGPGGPGGPPPAPKNLQVLPKDMTLPQVQATMAGVAQALGAQCTFCHVPAPPPPATPAGAAPPAAAGAGGRGRGGAAQLDFALDDKAEKKTARIMFTMVNDINARIAADVVKTGAPLTRVECVTCHRGVAVPKQLPEVVSNVMLTKGEGAAVATYRDLRMNYFGSQSYDFTEPVLVRMAQVSLATNKPDDALAYVKLNLEFYPQSGQTYATLSQIHARKNDRAQAVKDLQQAIVLEPDNMQFKRQLDQLNAQARTN